MGAQDRSDGASGSLAKALDPSSLLSLREAASLARVEVAEIEALVADGTLLSERSRKAGRETIRVRLFDLADHFPEVLGRPAKSDSGAAGDRTNGSTSDPGPGGEASGATPTEAPSQAAVTAAVAPKDGGSDGRPDGTSHSRDLAAGAPRASLIELAEDLETRLDLAERERQASTASLLMAQRRVLDLEADARRRPWSRAGGVLAIGSALGVLGLVIALPRRIEGAVRTETARIQTLLGESFQSSLTALEAELAAKHLASVTAAAEEWQQRDAEMAALVDELRAELGGSSTAIAAAETAIREGRASVLALGAEIERAREMDAQRRRDLDEARSAASAERVQLDEVIADLRAELERERIAKRDAELAAASVEAKLEESLRAELDRTIEALEEATRANRDRAAELAAERAALVRQPAEASFERGPAIDAEQTRGFWSRVSQRLAGPFKKGAN